MSKSKMSKAEITVKFAELSDEAYKVNGKIKDRRFYPMTENRNNRLYEFGVYDYKTKKYVLECIHSPDAEKALKEIKSLINSAFEK